MLLRLQLCLAAAAALAPHRSPLRPRLHLQMSKKDAIFGPVSPDDPWPKARDPPRPRGRGLICEIFVASDFGNAGPGAR